MRSTILSRIPRRGTLIVAATLLAFASCEQVEVVTVNAARVELSPQNPSIAVSETARLTATVLSSDGKTLTGRTIEWASLHTNIATVDNTGMVLGVATGTATIRASTGEASGTATVTVTAAPSISVSPSEVTFSAVQNSSAPGDRTVTVSNGGTGTLSGLSVAVRYAAGEPNNWLSASLAGTTAPTALILSANQGAFAPGTYNATVDISSSIAGVAIQQLPVRLTVLTPAPAIGLGTNSITFNGTAGGANPAQQQVGVTNAGGGSLTGLATTIDYTPGQPTGWLTAALTGPTAPTTLTLNAATAGLPAGNYTANVRVTSNVAQNSPQTIAVTFAVAAVQTSLALDQRTLTFTASRGGANPNPQAVQVTSLSSTQISGLAVSVTYGPSQPTGWATPTLSGTATPATVTVNAATGSLPTGIYTAIVSVASPNASNSPQTFDLAFNVVDPLNQPTNLTATAISSTQINLAWTPPGAGTVTRYRIERKTGAAGTYAVIDSTTTPSYQNTGLAPGTQYYYRVAACNALNCSPPSVEANATTAPGAPTSLTASAVSATQINLAWNAGPGAVTKYRIERKTGAAGAYAVIDSVPNGTLSYQNSVGLAPATQYFYRVQACNGSLCSPYSLEANATTGQIAPGAPSNLSANAVSAAQINLSWTAASGTVTRYRIERKLGAAGTYAAIDSVANTATTYNDVLGLAPNTQYYYRVQACNTAGCSPYSTEANATTAQVAPGTPSGLSATAVSAAQINLSWNASTGTVVNYRIERKTGAAGTYAVIDSVANGTTTYQNTGLTAATQYYYRVSACNAAGCSAPSTENNATTLPNPPSAPSGLTANAVSSTQINLSWTASATGPVSRYYIERSTSGGPFTQLDSLSATTYQNSGLSPGTQYTYQVKACNAGGCSAFSNTASATTTPVIPGVPGGLTASVISATQVNLSWNAASGFVESYLLERRTAAPNSSQIIATVSASTLSYQNTGLTSATQYFYQVRACNTGAGCSNPSTEVSATTLPAPPTSLGATAASATQINVTWNASTSSGITAYEIQRQSGGGAFATVGTVSSGTTFQDTGLTQNTQYTYQARACVNTNCSVYAGPVSATTMLQVPSVPTGLTATGISSSQISVSWTASTTGPVSAYELQRSAAGGGAPFATIFTGTATNHTDSGLTGSTVYQYQVRACNLTACSAYTAVVPATTGAATPSVPTGLAATPVSATQIDVSWNASAGSVTAYELQRQDPGGSMTTVFTGTATNFQDTGRSPATQYSYQVRACNGAACSAYTSAVIATTPAQTPSVPTGLAATPVSSTQIDVSWAASTTGPVTAYELQRQAPGGAMVTVFTGSATSYQDTNVSAATQYSYQVRACNGAACSAYTSTVSATTPAQTPSVPTGLAATPISDTQIDVSWTASATGPVTAYELQRQDPGGSMTTVFTGTATNFQDTGRSPATQYSYQVRACNGANCSAYTSTVSATTPAQTPSVPTGLTATAVSGTQIDVTWTASASGPVTSYELQRQPAGGSFTTVFTGTATSFSDMNLNGTTLYTYQVRACNGAQCSAFSATASATTSQPAPAAPANLSAAASSSAAAVALKWNPSTGATRYPIERRIGSSGQYVVIDSTSGTSYQDTNGLNWGSTYFYQVRACNSSGCSGSSSAASALTLPAVPANFAARIRPFGLAADLSWVPSQGASSYQLDYRTRPGPFSQLTTLNSGSQSTYTHFATLSTGLVNSNWDYRIRACNSTGCSNNAQVPAR